MRSGAELGRAEPSSVESSQANSSGDKPIRAERSKAEPAAVASLETHPAKGGVGRAVASRAPRSLAPAYETPRCLAVRYVVLVGPSSQAHMPCLQALGTAEREQGGGNPARARLAGAAQRTAGKLVSSC